MRFEPHRNPQCPTQFSILPACNKLMKAVDLPCFSVWYYVRLKIFFACFLNSILHQFCDACKMHALCCKNNIKLFGLDMKLLL